MSLVRFFVGLAGPPGAGKSTIAHEVAKRINKLWPEKASSFDSQVQPPDVAIVIPMDGFHLYRSELDAMEVSVLLLHTTLVIHLTLFPVHFIVHINDLELIS
jgi:pantothenate kinase